MPAGIEVRSAFPTSVRYRRDGKISISRYIDITSPSSGFPAT
jgi:hypothetical protein